MIGRCFGAPDVQDPDADYPELDHVVSPKASAAKLQASHEPRHPATAQRSQTAQHNAPTPVNSRRQFSASAKELPITATVAPPPKPSSILYVSPHIPPALARDVWSVKDFAIIKCLHKGYASQVFKVSHASRVQVCCSLQKSMRTVKHCSDSTRMGE